MQLFMFAQQGTISRKVESVRWSVCATESLGKNGEISHQMAISALKSILCKATGS